MHEDSVFFATSFVLYVGSYTVYIFACFMHEDSVFFSQLRPLYRPPLCSERYWAGLGATVFRRDPKDTAGDISRGYSKRSLLIFHIRGECTQSELWNKTCDEIHNVVSSTFIINELDVRKVCVWVGIIDTSSIPKKIIDRTHHFEDKNIPVTDDHCVKIRVLFGNPGEAEKGRYLALLEKSKMGWSCFGDPNATKLISCHIGFQSQFIPGVLVALCKDELKKMNIKVPTVELCVTWDSVGGKAKQTFCGVRAISTHKIFKGRQHATKMKSYLASIRDDSVLGPDIVELIQRVLEVRGVHFTCTQLPQIALMIATKRIFFVADRKALQGFLGSPHNS